MADTKKFLDQEGLKTLVGKIKKELNGKQASGNYATLVDGKVPLSQLGNIDTTFVEVLTDISKLPTTNISKHIYLVPNSSVGQNKYAEYVYTGALPINSSNVYDSSKWEKLGDFQAEVDLTEYSKTKDTVSGVVAGTNDASSIKINVTKNNATAPISIPSATTSAAGAMSAADKSILTKLANRYPFDISGFNASPSVAEVGVATAVTLNWGYQNEDFHTVSSQSVKGTQGITGDVSVIVGTKSYKTASITASAGADKVTATFTLTSKADSNATTKTRTCSTTFVHAGYCGVVAANKTSLTAAEIIALGNKAVINGKNRTVSISQSNQKLVYAYPAYFGDLTSIKDGNGFQGFNGYTKLAAVTVNGALYNVYMQNTPATATGSYTFA